MDSILLNLLKSLNELNSNVYSFGKRIVPHVVLEQLKESSEVNEKLTRFGMFLEENLLSKKDILKTVSWIVLNLDYPISPFQNESEFSLTRNWMAIKKDDQKKVDKIHSFTRKLPQDEANKKYSPSILKKKISDTSFKSLIKYPWIFGKYETSIKDNIENLSNFLRNDLVFSFYENIFIYIHPDFFKDEIKVFKIKIFDKQTSCYEIMSERLLEEIIDENKFEVSLRVKGFYFDIFSSKQLDPCCNFYIRMPFLFGETENYVHEPEVYIAFKKIDSNQSEGFAKLTVLLELFLKFFNSQIAFPVGKQHGIKQALRFKEKLIGSSNSFESVKNAIKAFNEDHLGVLLYGESGVGKKNLARVVHNRINKNKPFIFLDAGIMSSDQIIYRLFGEGRREFGEIGSSVQNGLLKVKIAKTVYINNINRLTTLLQKRILKNLLNKNRTFKLIGAINTSKHEHEAGFDYFNTGDLSFPMLSLKIPSLRKRKEDIGKIANDFVNYYSNLYDKNVSEIQNDQIEFLKNYSWSGNLKELETVISFAVASCSGNIITLEDLQNIIPSRKFNDLYGDNQKVFICKMTGIKIFLDIAIQAYDFFEKLRNSEISPIKPVYLYPTNPRIIMEAREKGILSSDEFKWAFILIFYGVAWKIGLNSKEQMSRVSSIFKVNSINLIRHHLFKLGNDIAKKNKKDISKSQFTIRELQKKSANEFLDFIRGRAQ